MKQVKLASQSALLCLLMSSSVLALSPATRLGRLMCGKPLAFRPTSAQDFGLGPVVRAQPGILASLNGSAQRFRTSAGEAECLTAEFQVGPAASPQTVPSVDAFWAKFQTAVQKGDKTSVAAMSQFPIEMPYGYPKIRNRTQLVRRWREVFNTQANAVKCFADAKPVIDSDDPKRFTVGCKDAAGNEVVVYGFLRGRAGWRFIFLDNINE